MTKQIVDDFVSIVESDDGTRLIKIHNQVFKLPARVGVYSTTRGIRFNYQIHGKRYTKTTKYPELYVVTYEDFIKEVLKNVKLYSIYFIRRWTNVKSNGLPEHIGLTNTKNIDTYVMYDPIEDRIVYLGKAEILRHEDLIYRSNKMIDKLKQFELTLDDIF